MGILGNLDHERFCQAYHKRVWTGEKHVQAAHAAYRETIWEGEGEPLDIAIAANVRRLRNRKEVKARIGELADYAGRLAGIDSGWAMLELARRVENFNLADYMSPEGSDRHFDLTHTIRTHLGKLSEVTIEDERTIMPDGEDGPVVRIRKTKLKGYDPASVIGLMARIAGWEAPKKIAPTTIEGDNLTLESLVSASMKPKDTAQAA